MAIFKITKENNIKKIKFLNITMWKKKVDILYKKYYLCGIKIFEKSTINKIFSKHKKTLKKYNKIYVINSNIGEAYLLFKYFSHNLITNKTIFIATKQYHVDIMRSFIPQCPYILDTEIDLDKYPKNFSMGNKKIYILFNHEYYISLEKDIREQEQSPHYFQRMKEFFNFNDETITNQIKIQNGIEQSVINKTNEIGLNLNNFIFIAPEANSCLDIDDYILDEINISLQNAGFDVFWNINSLHEDFKNYKTCFLTLQEAIALSSKAKAIISLRSGLAEFLTETNVPMYVVYSKLKNRAPQEQMSADKVLKGFTLSKLPNYRNNIKEYINYGQNDYRKCFSEILEELCQIM